MSTLSRSRTLAGLLAVAAVLALAVSPVAGKEGAIAKLETFVHRDAEPGSTIKVGWSTFMLTAGGEHPIHSSVETMRLVGPGGDSTEAIGIETPADSGHYRVSMAVPEGGIEQIQLSVRGDACIDTVGCDRVDYAFPLTDDAAGVGEAGGHREAGRVGQPGHAGCARSCRYHFREQRARAARRARRRHRAGRRTRCADRHATAPGRDRSRRAVTASD